MASPAELVAVASPDVGVVENPANSNRVVMADGQDLWAWYGPPGEGNPWCGAAVSYWFHKIGMGDQVHFAYCPAGWARFRAEGRVDQNPEIGDVVFFEWEHDTIVDHTGIVIGFDAGHIYTIEGNAGTRNGGGVVKNSRARGAYMFFGKPNWSHTPAPPAPTPTQPWEVQVVSQLPTLKVGAKELPNIPGPIHKAQALLNVHGAKLNIDGDFGPATDVATKSFQTAAKLAVDGVIGQASWTALVLA